VLALFLATLTHAAEPGATNILKWKDGKTAPFLLSFDDSCSSHLDVVIPALEKHGMVGNFYINPGKGVFPGRKAEWEKVATSRSVALQNHTFTHVGATSVAQLDEELAKCNDSLKALNSDKKWPRLIGFGQPGGVPWEVSETDVTALLAEHHLVNRPSFNGPPIHQKSAGECIATIDKALASGELGHLDMHGVGSDWLVTPVDWFEAILEKLAKEGDKLWITDIVSLHQYEKEREESKVVTTATSDSEIQISLTNGLDPSLYDMAITLETNVPPAWKTCTVKQGDKNTEITPEDGKIRYDALPGSLEIVIIGKK